MLGRGLRTENTRISGEERSKREERAHRILDAAAELIQRWGYKKTTIDDVARSAGVAKGTIYLHWKTREDLFMALLLRESVEMLKAVTERIDSDPEGLYLSHMVQHAIYVVMTRPLSRALFIQDVSVLGELLQSGREDLELITQQKLLAGQQLLALFRAKGALRTDRSIKDQIKMYGAMVMGFMTLDQYLPVELHSSPEEATRLLSEMIHATLEPAEPVAPEVLIDLRTTWDHFAQQFGQVLTERLQKEME